MRPREMNVQKINNRLVVERKDEKKEKLKITLGSGSFALKLWD